MSARPCRWVTPEGARIDLAHLTHTSGRLVSRGLRDRGAVDGWCLTVRHPRSAVVISETWLGATVPEGELAAALSAVEAVRVDDLPCPARP